MSGTRRNLVLACVFGALAVLYVLGLLLNRVPPPAVVVGTFKGSLADRILAGPTKLRKGANGSWQVSIGGRWFPADRGKVDAMLATLSGMTAGRVASSSRSNWTDFQVDSATASPLSIASKRGPLVQLYVGKASADGGVYVRNRARPDVYDVFKNIAGYVSADSSYWSYLQILPRSIDVNSLQTISITGRGFTVGGESVDESYLLESSFVGGKNAWVVHGRPGVTVDQQKVLALEAEIIRMQGDSFVADKSASETGVDRPQATITISDQQGSSWTIEVGKRYGAQFYVKRSGAPYIYLVNEWTLHRAVPRLSTLLAGAKPASSGAQKTPGSSGA